MSLEALAVAKNRAIGTKQTLKSVNRGEAQKVYVALDADRQVTGPLLELCAEKGIQVIRVDSMAELGKACGIQVGSASAAIVNKK